MRMYSPHANVCVFFCFFKWFVCFDVCMGSFPLMCVWAHNNPYVWHPYGYIFEGCLRIWHPRHKPPHAKNTVIRFPHKVRSISLYIYTYIYIYMYIYIYVNIRRHLIILSHLLSVAFFRGVCGEKEEGVTCNGFCVSHEGNVYHTHSSSVFFYAWQHLTHTSACPTRSACPERAHSASPS
jgi:hypothetical protein